MDTGFKTLSDSPIAIIGYGYVAPHSDGETSFDVTPHLRDRKSLKCMAKQDRLAVFAATRAVSQAKLNTSGLESSTGIYFTVGTIPFEDNQLENLFTHSMSKGCFDMDRFSSEAFLALNPLMTFKCLPNMPVFHVSYNLGIKGPYFVTYPGPGQWFQALKYAVSDLQNGKVDYALVGAVADQRNFLVRHHFGRINDAVSKKLADASCVLVLTAKPSANATAVITGLDVRYDPVDPLSRPHIETGQSDSLYFGPVEPCLALAKAIEESKPNKIRYQLATQDGIMSEVRMEVL